MIGGFILIKVLVCRIMAQTNITQVLLKMGINQMVNSTPNNGRDPKVNAPRFNMKILSSLFYYIVVEYMESLLASKGYSEDLLWTCGLRNILYKHTDVKLYYKQENYQTRSEHFTLLESFLKQLTNLLNKTLSNAPQNFNSQGNYVRQY